MTSTTKAWIAAAVAVLFSAGLIAWQVKATRAGAVTLTADDMSKLAELQSPRDRQRLASDADARKKFAEDLKRLLSLAEAARAAGIADKPEVKRQLDLMRSLIIAQGYISKQQGGTQAASVFAIASPTEIENFMKEPGQDQKFQQFLEDAQGLGFQIPPTLSDDMKKQIQQQWAQIMIAERKALQAGADRDRATELQVMLQQARFLVERYAQDQLIERTKATDDEVKAYMQRNPEMTQDQARAKAQEIVQRVRGGEDFAALAKQYSADPVSKEQGGELGWFGHGQMVKQFEDAAFSLQPGQTSDVVETNYGFHIIQVEERRTQPGANGQPEEQIRARHILISAGPPPSANPFMPQQSAEDRAREAVEDEKRKKLIDEIVQRSHVSVAENFTVAPPSPEELRGSGRIPTGEQGGDEDEIPSQVEEQQQQANPHGNSNAAAARPGAQASPAARPQPRRR